MTQNLSFTEYGMDMGLSADIAEYGTYMTYPLFNTEYGTNMELSVHITACSTDEAYSYPFSPARSNRNLLLLGIGRPFSSSAQLTPLPLHY